MPEPKRLLKVFLCHVSQDKLAVRDLYSALKAEGWIDPWLDKAKILPGQDWRTVIEKAVEDSDVVIVCLSTQSVSKEGFVQREIKYSYDIALEKPEDTIFLIPLRLDDCAVPRGLRSFHWVNYFDTEKNDAYSDLLDALKLRHEQKLRLEEEERTHKEKEKQKREAAEKIAQERIDRENAEKDFVEKMRLEEEEQARQKAVKDEIERKAAEKATREREKRDTAKKARQKRIEWSNARKDAVTKTLFKPFASLKLAPAPAKSLFLGIGIIAMTIVGLWAMSPLFPSLSIAKTSATVTPIPPTRTFTPTPTKIYQFTWTPRPTSTITLTPTASLTPTPIPTDSFLLKEDFEDGVANGSGWRFESCNCVVEKDINGNRYLSATGTEGQYVVISYGDKNLHWTDYAFESRIKLVSGARDLGLWVRADRGSAFYSFLLYKGDIMFQEKNDNDNVNEFYNATARTFKQDQWYTIRVEITGNLISAYVDNVFLSKAYLRVPLINKQGGIGFGFEGGGVLNFDDIRVWSLK